MPPVARLTGRRTARPSGRPRASVPDNAMCRRAGGSGVGECGTDRVRLGASRPRRPVGGLSSPGVGLPGRWPATWGDRLGGGRVVLRSPRRRSREASRAECIRPLSTPQRRGVFGAASIPPRGTALTPVPVPSHRGEPEGRVSPAGKASLHRVPTWAASPRARSAPAPLSPPCQCRCRLVRYFRMRVPGQDLQNAHGCGRPGSKPPPDIDRPIVAQQTEIFLCQFDELQEIRPYQRSRITCQGVPTGVSV